MTQAEYPTSPSKQDLFALIEQMDRETVRDAYYKAIVIMQAKMQENQEPF